MYKSKPEQLPDTELDIMRVLWKSNKPLTAAEIIDAMGRSWKLPTAHVLLKRLCDKGYAKIAAHEGRSNSFSSLITEKEYNASLMRSICGGSVKHMVASLIDTDGISDKDIDEIAALLKEKKRELCRKKVCK